MPQSKRSTWWAGMPLAMAPEAASRLHEFPAPRAEALGEPPEVRQDVSQGGEAVIQVRGMLGHPWAGTSYDGIRSLLASAAGDPRVASVVLDIDTPGGFTVGLHETACALRDFNKPLTAVVNGQAQSAGYWLASSCDRIEAAPTAVIGCVGTIVTLFSATAVPGNPVVDIVSPSTPYKSGDPAVDEVRAAHEAVCEEITSVFLDDIAAGRSMPRDGLASAVGGGLSFGARAALARGMIDEITGADAPATEEGAGMADKETKGEAAEAAAEPEMTEDEKREDLKLRIAALEAELAEMGGDDAAEEESAEAAAAAEDEAEEKEKPEEARARARVAQLRAEARTLERENAVGNVIKAGKCLPCDQALAEELYEGEKAGRHKMFTERFASAEANSAVDLGARAHAGAGPKPLSESATPRQRLDHAARAHMATAGCTYIEAINLLANQYDV